MSIDPILQDAMDRLRRIEFDLSKHSGKAIDTATRTFSGLVNDYRRAMVNNHGINVPILPNSHFEEEDRQAAEAISEEPASEPEIKAEPSSSKSKKTN